MKTFGNFLKTTLTGGMLVLLLEQQLPKVKLFYLTVNLDADLAAEAFRLGASGYGVENSAATELAGRFT